MSLKMIIRLCSQFDTMKDSEKKLSKLSSKFFRDKNAISLLLGQITKSLLFLVLSNKQNTMYTLWMKHIDGLEQKASFNSKVYILLLALALKNLNETGMISQDFTRGFLGDDTKKDISNQNIIEMIQTLHLNATEQYDHRVQDYIYLNDRRFHTVLNFGKETLSPRMGKSSASPATSVSISPELKPTGESPEGGVSESKL